MIDDNQKTFFDAIQRFANSKPEKVLREVTIMHDGWEMDNMAWIVQMADGSVSAFATDHNSLVEWSAQDAREKLAETQQSADAIARAIQLMGWEAPKNQQRIKPPHGYLTWLDYAVQCMDTRSPNIDLLLSDLPEISREDMQAAVELELHDLRRLAGVADTYGARDD